MPARVDGGITGGFVVCQVCRMADSLVVLLCTGCVSMRLWRNNWWFCLPAGVLACLDGRVTGGFVLYQVC